MTWPSCHQLSLSQSSWVSFLPFMQTWKYTEEPLAVLSCSYSRDFLSHLLLYVARQEELHLFRGVLKHMMVCSKGMVPILSVIAQVKQNYMTTELFRVQESLEAIISNLLLKQFLLGQVAQGIVKLRAGYLQGWLLHLPLWAPGLVFEFPPGDFFFWFLIRMSYVPNCVCCLLS